MEQLKENQKKENQYEVGISFYCGAKNVLCFFFFHVLCFDDSCLCVCLFNYLLTGRVVAREEFEPEFVSQTRSIGLGLEEREEEVAVLKLLDYWEICLHHFIVLYYKQLFCCNFIKF